MALLPRRFSEHVECGGHVGVPLIGAAIDRKRLLLDSRPSCAIRCSTRGLVYAMLRHCKRSGDAVRRRADATRKTAPRP